MNQGLLFPDERIQVVGDGQFRVASKSSPGTWHEVRGGRCDCQGFRNRGRCWHMDLLVANGYIRPDEIVKTNPGRVVGEPFDPQVSRVWVARYQNPVVASGVVVPVQTSRGGPKFTLGYRLEQMLELAPAGDTLRLSYQPFVAAYRARLDRLGAAAIDRTIEALRQLHGGLPVALLCFEDTQGVTSKPGWCHRTIFAEWWFEQTGERVPEILEG